MRSNYVVKTHYTCANQIEGHLSIDHETILSVLTWRCLRYTNENVFLTLMKMCETVELGTWKGAIFTTIYWSFQLIFSLESCLFHNYKFSSYMTID